MLKKALILLKKNPLLMILPVLAVGLVFVSELPMLQDINKVMGLSRSMYNVQSPPQMQLQDAMEIMRAGLLMLLFGLVYCVLAVIFVSGYGNMLAAAVSDGKATMKIFLYGIKKFIGKMTLSFLLFVAVMIGASLVISIVTTPILLASMAGARFDPVSMMNTQKTMQLAISVIMLFLYPFILMWFPAVFMEREEGVTACFRKGIRAGVRNYLPMVAVVAFILLPTLCIYIFTDIYSLFETMDYMLLYVYQAIVLPVISAYLFVRYSVMKAQDRNRSISV
ncbi:MAG TPA: hypothetical protein VHT96_14860 [Clostridia bacterium]|nr:hypothetical protein [Clostridia bacterium]